MAILFLIIICVGAILIDIFVFIAKKCTKKPNKTKQNKKSKIIEFNDLLTFEELYEDNEEK